jgi:hypothetical protein
MKKTIISVALALIMVGAFAEEKKVTIPDMVKKAFSVQYPNVAKVEWSLEKTGEYEAEFKLNNTDMSVVYDEKGTALEIESEIKEIELPQDVKATIAKDFAGYKISEVEKTDAKGVITFEISAEKGEKEFELVFDKNGKLLKQKMENEEKDKD